MKRLSFAPPLTIALLFGLALTMFASSPVYGGNVASCQGTGNSAARVALAGRVITPSTILRTANGQPCGSNETALSLVSLNRTIVVSSTGTPTENGTALLTAMDTISNSNPSVNNPWLLKLEPGNYDMGSKALVLKPYVDLEGSGEGTTVISSTIESGGSSITNGTLMMASNTEARFLKIVNGGTGSSFRTAIYTGDSSVTNVRVTHVTTDFYGSVTVGQGLYAGGSTVTVQDSTINGAGAIASGVFVTNGKVTIRNSIVTAPSGNAGYAIYNRNATVIIENNNLSTTANITGSSAYAVISNNGTVTINNSTLSASTVSNLGYGVFNTSSGTITLRNSSLSGSNKGIGLNGGTINVVATLVSGGTNVISGTLICVNSYNSSFVALNTSCA
jgi:hypothetical protein